LRALSQANRLLQKLYGTNLIEALYLIYSLQQSLDLKGDVCEFGVANGGTSTLIANELKRTDKKLFLFDSFQGLSKPTNEDKLINDMFNLKSMAKYEGTMSYSESIVKNKLQGIKFPTSRTKIIKGFIEDSLKQNNLPKKICFAYLDFDLYKPTILTLNYLDKYLSKKGYIVVDDYNFFSQGVKKAVDEFIKKNKKNYKIIYSKKYEGNFCIINKI
jgi:O-methyltransferase